MSENDAQYTTSKEDYPFKGDPLDKGITRVLMCKLCLGEYLKRDDIRVRVLKYHLRMGGLDPEIELKSAISKILSEFEKKGIAERHPLSIGRWKILSDLYEEVSIGEVGEVSIDEVDDISLEIIEAEIEFLDQLIKSLQDRKSKLQHVISE